MSTVNSTTSTILGAIEKTVKLGWGATRCGANSIYNAAERAWNFLPEGAKTTVNQAWENPRYATTIKGTAVVAAAALAAVPTAALATSLGLGATASYTAATVAAVAAGNTTLKAEDPKAAVQRVTALAAGELTGMAALLAAPIVGPMIAGATAVGTAPLAAASMFMALHPREGTWMAIPTLKPFELRTVGDPPKPPAPVEESLEALRDAPNAFIANHPNGMYSERQHVLVEDPAKAEKLRVQKGKTDIQKEALVENLSTFVSAYFIFVNRLGLDLIPDNTLMDMTQMALKKGANGEKLYSLWDACMEILERRNIELSFFQKIRAKFWYFLTDSIGIIPNMFNALADNILHQLRGGVEGEKPTFAISKILSISQLFFLKYNLATKKYANEHATDVQPSRDEEIEEEDDNEHYWKPLIDKLGDKGALARALEEMNPGDDLGKLMMHELCKEFVATIVDDPDLFPSISLFNEWKKISVFGVRIGIIFDLLGWLIEGIINWVARKLVKWYVPDFVQSLVQKGIKQTMPGSYSFKIAIASALKEQVDQLKKELDNGIPSTPLRFEENRQLTQVITQLIKALELETCFEDPISIKMKLEKLEHPTPEALQEQQILQTTMINGAQLLIHYYTNQPEAIEELFEKLFTLFTDSFQPGAPVYTEANYNSAKRSLEESVNKLVQAQVKEGVREKLAVENEEYNQTVLHGKRIKLDDQEELARVDAQRRPLYPAPGLRDPEGNLTYQLDKDGVKPVHKGLFKEQKDKALSTVQVLQGLVLKMVREIHRDANATLLALPPGMHQAPEEAAPREDLSELEKKIAIKQAKLRQEIATLEAQIAAVGPEDAGRGEKLKALQEQIDFASEELRLVRAMEEHNALETPNDHPLKNLENYMKMIGEFAEHAKSLNIDLYSEIIQSTFNRTFAPIYQDFVPLTEQLNVLQKLEKSYDKAKRLEERFAEVAKIIQQNPSNLLDILNEKLNIVIAIDKDFNEFESDPDRIVKPFKNAVDQLKQLDKELKSYDNILNEIQELGRLTDPSNPQALPEQPQTLDGILSSLGQLSYAVLAHPKDTIDQILRKIPSEDREKTGPLMRAIDELQEKAAMSPIPDLNQNHTAVRTQLRVIVRKYLHKKTANIMQKRQKLQDLVVSANNRSACAARKRNTRRNELLQGLNETNKPLDGLKKLKADTDALAYKIEHVQLARMHNPVGEIVRQWPGAEDGYANPIIDNMKKLTDSAYNFITSPQIMEATARLTLSEYIRTHKKPK